jgi:hypothetical protein
MGRFERVYDIHGQPLLVITNDALIAAAAQEALAGFPVGRAGKEQPLVIVMQAVQGSGEVPLNLSEAAVLIRETANQAGEVSCRLYRDAPLWLLDFGAAGRMVLDTVKGRLEGWLVQTARQATEWTASFVLLAAIELLRTRGLYTIHGAALEKDGRGVLIVGASGAGKTTACLSLMRAGYGCLSDDHPLLEAGGPAMTLLPFRGRVAVTERTIGWFPELAAAQQGFRLDTRKRSFEVEAVPGYRFGGACEPVLLLFPRIVDWPKSSVEALAGARALEELLPQTLLVLDPCLAGKQFQVMSELVRKIPAYRLHFGEDVTNLPEIIDRLLETHRG